uniref:Uncharacterized protein n=1 Tax=Arundo donax TaxID=35708 RepID=A0A0A9FN14_ARUDO
MAASGATRMSSSASVATATWASTPPARPGTTPCLPSGSTSATSTRCRPQASTSRTRRPTTSPPVPQSNGSHGSCLSTVAERGSSSTSRKSSR